jgi:hypothetical protein
MALSCVRVISGFGKQQIIMTWMARLNLASKLVEVLVMFPKFRNGVSHARL